MTSVPTEEPGTIVTIEIVLDEDWADPLPQFLDQDSGGAEIPLDLTGATLELFIRPTYDHATLIKKCSTDDGTIVFDNAALGLAHFQVERPTAVSDLPVGSWQQFLILKVPVDDLDGWSYRELWRGPFIVHAGRTELRGLDFSDPLNSQYLPLIAGLFGG